MTRREDSLASSTTSFANVSCPLELGRDGAESTLL